MNDSRNEQRMMQEVMNALMFGLQWTLLLLFSAFLVSRWLTRMLFEKVLDPLTNFFFERNDGAAVIVSALLWAVVGECILLFAIYNNPQDATLTTQESILSALSMGACWGAVIGGWLVFTWWSEVANAPIVVSDFKQALNLPASFYQGK